MITFSGVSKRYQTNHALYNINLQIDAGEMVFLTGHSGAGKSTLLKLIHHVERPSRGTITVNQKPIHALKRFQIPRHRRNIGVIYQDPCLLNHRTVFDNVALPLIITRYSEHEIGRRVRAALDKVGLLDKERHFPWELSTGECQRVGVARAIVNRPQIILADEPTGNLDPDLSLDVMRLFQAFNAVGVTIVVATHDLPLIAQLSCRILHLKDGQLMGEPNA